MLLKRKEPFRNKHKEPFQNKIVEIEIPEIYPISTEFDYDNITNFTDNDTVIRINELSDLVIKKINGNDHVILFNSALRQTTPIKVSIDESTDYGEYIVTTLNEVAIFKQYTFDKIINISKDEMENQQRLNFHLLLNYTNSKSGTKVPLTFNVIILLEQLYDNGDQVMFKTDQEISTYLDEFRLLGLPNNGYIPGTIQ